MDIFGILDPDPHENLCGSETLIDFKNLFLNPNTLSRHMRYASCAFVMRYLSVLCVI